jgi:glycosyltransferase involved in cell wall biosynthesis
VSVPLIVVMPVYNEADCLREMLAEWLAALQAIPGALLLLVDDGSRDETPALLAEAARRQDGIRVVRQENAGHGAAILHGYREALAAGAEWVFQADADRQIAAAPLLELWMDRAGAPFLQAARWPREDPEVRILLSRAHRRLLAVLFGHAPRDPNVPFRLMRAEVLREMLCRLPEQPFAPNVMLSLLAQKQGWLRDELDVPHRQRDTGTQSIHGWKTARIAWRCAGELWRFRWGGYRQ